MILTDGGSNAFNETIEEAKLAKAAGTLCVCVGGGG